MIEIKLEKIISFQGLSSFSTGDRIVLKCFTKHNFEGKIVVKSIFDLSNNSNNKAFVLVAFIAVSGMNYKEAVLRGRTESLWQLLNNPCMTM